MLGGSGSNLSLICVDVPPEYIGLSRFLAYSSNCTAPSSLTTADQIFRICALINCILICLITLNCALSLSCLGKPYLDLVVNLCYHNHIPLALYRTSTIDLQKYVVTNPARKTKLRENDKVYIQVTFVDT